MMPSPAEKVDILLKSTRLASRILELAEEPEFEITHMFKLEAAWDVIVTGMARMEGVDCHVSSATRKVLARALADVEVHILYDKLGIKCFWGTPPLGVVK